MSKINYKKLKKYPTSSYFNLGLLIIFFCQFFNFIIKYVFHNIY